MSASIRFLMILSFIAGYADTATFLHLYGLFSAHVTGNFVLLAASIGNGVYGHDALKVLSFPVFVASVFAATFIHDHMCETDETSRSAYNEGLLRTTGILLIFASLIALFFAGASTGGHVSFGDSVAGMVCVVAMGMQNAVHRLAPALGPPTTIMTGNVTQSTVLVARKLFPGTGAVQPPPTPAAFSLQRFAAIVFAFIFGCLVSAPLTLVFGLFSLIVAGASMLGAIYTNGAEARQATLDHG